MIIKRIKIFIAIFLFAGLLGSSLNTKAYPAYLRQAAKFGAKDCLFCHQKPEGGEPWNERGQWLIAEKERRKADAIDVAWLAEYKEGEKKVSEQKQDKKKESEIKEGDKKEGDKKDDVDHAEHKDSDKEKKGDTDKTDKKEGEKEKKGDLEKADKKEGEKEKKEEPKKKEKPN